MHTPSQFVCSRFPIYRFTKAVTRNALHQLLCKGFTDGKLLIRPTELVSDGYDNQRITVESVWINFPSEERVSKVASLFGLHFIAINPRYSNVLRRHLPLYSVPYL